MNELLIISQHNNLNSFETQQHVALVKLAVPNMHFLNFSAIARELDSGCFVGTILTNLSKAYDCISHEVLIATLECYSLDRISFTRFRMGFFAAANGWGEGKKIPFPKICHGCPKIMNLWWRLLLYPKKIRKIYKSRDMPLQFCFFQRKAAIFVKSRNTYTDCILTCNF